MHTIIEHACKNNNYNLLQKLSLQKNFKQILIQSKSILKYVCKYGSCKIIKLLLNCFSKKEQYLIFTKSHVNPLYSTIRLNRCHNIIKYLLDSGSKVQSTIWVQIMSDDILLKTVQYIFEKNPECIKFGSYRYNLLTVILKRTTIKDHKIIELFASKIYDNYITIYSIKNAIKFNIIRLIERTSGCSVNCYNLPVILLNKYFKNDYSVSINNSAIINIFWNMLNCIDLYPPIKKETSIYIIKVINFFKEKGFNFKQCFNQPTILHNIILLYNNIDIKRVVKLLIKYGCSVNVYDNKKMMPIHYLLYHKVSKNTPQCYYINFVNAATTINMLFNNGQQIDDKIILFVLSGKFQIFVNNIKDVKIKNEFINNIEKILFKAFHGFLGGSVDNKSNIHFFFTNYIFDIQTILPIYQYIYGISKFPKILKKK
jgi:hypothetical protein